MLVSSGKKKQARQKVTQWLDKFRLEPDNLVKIVAPAIDSLPNDKWSQAQRIELYKLALEARPNSVSFISGFVDAQVRAGKSKAAFEFLEKQRLAAKKDTDRLLAIIPAYGRLSSMPAARKALLELSSTLLRERPLDSNLRRMHLDQLKVAGLKKEALKAVIDWRRYAPDFPELVLEHVNMLRSQLFVEEAERVLSELVEFNPHDFDARSTYARLLAAKRAFAKYGQPAVACAQYTRAVQLNPSKRETFRTMMALRRSHPKASKQIGQCIVNGVSRLPIIRDVSIVMLWEDPSADIDMHVIEPGGEEVSYEHLESAQGGHLYYDVTDGFGPEIYVLGSGKPGTYRLSVVYYSGSASVVRGKMIVMRHAGGPEETRKVYPFKLNGSNSSKSIPVGSFKLSR